MTRPEAAAFLGVSADMFHKWVQSGEVVMTRYRINRTSNTPILYPAEEVWRLREARSRRGQPYPDPLRPGCWRVPLRTVEGYLEAIIDAEDLPKVVGKRWNFVRRTDGEPRPVVVRATGRRGGPHTQLRRVVLGVEDQGAALKVSHANGDALDCRRCNLVVQTAAQSTRRGYKITHRAGRPTTSRYKGVCWAEREGKWMAQIRVNDVHMGLGVFDDEEQAAAAYDEAARRAWGAEARVNFPDHGELPTAIVAPAEGATKRAA